MIRIVLFIALRVIAVLLVLCVPVFSIRAGQQSRDASRTKTATYSCPMHPSDKSNKPGKCRRCGMSLQRPATGASDAAAGASKTAPSTSAKIIFPDVELLDQDGRKIRFYSDLVKSKVVVINFIFTTCTTICPPLGATFARVQKDLGEHAGTDVQLISVSVDPVTDTPERLKAWGAKFKAGTGWTLLTGEKQHIDSLLSALSALTARREDHTPMVIIANDARGQWTRTYGLTSPSQLVKMITAAIEGHLEAPSEAKREIDQ